MTEWIQSLEGSLPAPVGIAAIVLVLAVVLYLTWKDARR